VISARPVSAVVVEVVDVKEGEAEYVDMRTEVRFEAILGDMMGRSESRDRRGMSGTVESCFPATQQSWISEGLSKGVGMSRSLVRRCGRQRTANTPFASGRRTSSRALTTLPPCGKNLFN